MDDWKTLAIAILGSTALGSAITAYFKRSTESHKITSETETNQFEILTARMNTFTDKLTDRLDECEARCKACEADHEATKVHLAEIQGENNELAVRIQALENRKSGN